jgi:hypothetical protein
VDLETRIEYAQELLGAVNEKEEAAAFEKAILVSIC